MQETRRPYGWRVFFLWGCPAFVVEFPVGVIPCALQHEVMLRRHGTSARTRGNTMVAKSMEGLAGGAEVPALAALGRDDKNVVGVRRP